MTIDSRLCDWIITWLTSRLFLQYQIYDDLDLRSFEQLACESEVASKVPDPGETHARCSGDRKLRSFIAPVHPIR